MIIVGTGVTIFIISLGFNVYFGRKDNTMTKDLALSLVDANNQQIKAFDAIKKIIDKINMMKLNVRFSQISLEKFRIGNFLEGINIELQRSLQRASFLQHDFFYSNKNGTYVRILLISLSVLIILFLYVVFYIRRKLNMNLILTACMVILMIVSLNSVGILFTNFSINVEICDLATKVFDQSYGDIRYRINHNFNEFLTCFNFETKQSLKSQLMSNLIASNSVLIIFRNYFYVEDQTFITKGYFDSVASVENHKIEILERLEDVLNGGDSDSYTLMRNYLNVIQVLNTLNKKVESLTTCDNLKYWADRINKKMCRFGLKYQFYSGISFFCKFIIFQLRHKYFTSQYKIV